MKIADLHKERINESFMANMLDKVAMNPMFIQRMIMRYGADLVGHYIRQMDLPVRRSIVNKLKRYNEKNTDNVLRHDIETVIAGAEKP